MDNNTPKTSAPALTLDVDLYQHYLDNSDLTQEEKIEFLQALWNLINEFVMLGFNVHPIQQVQKRSEQPLDYVESTTLLTSNMVDSPDLALTTNLTKTVERTGAVSPKERV